MNIIAIETATTACAIGIRTSQGHEVLRVIDEDRQHTEALTEGMAALLAEVALRPRDIERVVVDHGPGLFTGLRVGIATGWTSAVGEASLAVVVTGWTSAVGEASLAMVVTD